MKKIVFALGIVAAAGFIASGAFADQPMSKNNGEAEFKEHCAVCHANGGNIINPKKTLSKKDREANNIKSASDIIKNMRNPGPGMTKFDEKTVSNAEAKAIADYILKTF
jgi:cytochrome c6